MANLRAAVGADERLSVVPMDERVAVLTGWFESPRCIDDRCIVATAGRLVEDGRDAVLVTRDAAVRAAGLVPTTWEWAGPPTAVGWRRSGSGTSS